jgi:hypothetical protein
LLKGANYSRKRFVTLAPSIVNTVYSTQPYIYSAIYCHVLLRIEVSLMFVTSSPELK